MWERTIGRKDIHTKNPNRKVSWFNGSYTNKCSKEDFIEVWEYLANIAEGNYRSFLEKLNLFDRDSRKAVGSSALYYGEILNVVRKNDYDCLTKRNYVSSFNILNLKLRNILKV